MTIADDTPTVKAAPRIARNLVWLTLGDAVSRGGVFVYALLVARTLGPERFGVFALAQGTALYVWIGVDLGVNLYGAREVARAGDAWRPVVQELLGLRLAAAFAMTVLYVAGSALLAPEGTFGALAFGGAYLLANALSLDWAAKGMDAFHLPALANALSAIVALAGFALLVRAVPDPAVAAGTWGAAYFAGAAVLLLTLGRRVGARVVPSFDPAAWRRHLRASLFFAASGAMLSAMQYAPIVALTSMGGFGELGHFSAAARIVTVVMSAGFLLPMAMYPTLSRRAAGGGLEDAARILQVAMLGLGLAAGGMIFLLAEPVVQVLYGEEYVAGARLLSVLAWIVPLVFVRYSVGSVLLAAGRQRAHALASLAGVLVTIAGCALSADRGAVLGVSFAWLAGEGVVTVGMASIWLGGVRARA